MLEYLRVSEENPQVQKFIKEIEEFSEWIFCHHKEKPVRAAKVIHDAVWGTNRFEQGLVSLIDTPLIQRLRHILQTGNSHLIYPSTRHTRFEHTLGVTSNIRRMLKALDDKFNSTDSLRSKKGLLSDQLNRTLLMAGILHDCGHGPFSHTSEEIYRNYDEIKEIQKHVPFKSASPHEILSYLIISSKRFSQFFDKIETDYTLDIDPILLKESIVGYIGEPQNQYKVDFLNGPFDADKIDYLYRDGHFSGLPLKIDLDRLWYSMDVNSVEGRRRLTIDFSGMTCLEQILFCKMMLYPSLYQHHKVRACDCMFKGIVELLKKIDKPLIRKVNGEEKVLDLSRAAHFLYVTDTDFYDFSLPQKNEDLHTLLHNLQYRRLLKRAVVISHDTIQDECKAGYYKFIKYKEQSTIVKGYEFYRYIAHLIYEEADCPGLFEELWVDLPKDPDFQEADETYISPLGRGEPPLRLSEFFKNQQYAQQYKIKKSRGHVFCRPEYLDKVASATVKIFKQELGIEFKKLAFHLCHADVPSGVSD